MSIRLSRPKGWFDTQNPICMACSELAVMKIEARPDGYKGTEYGPAQTLRLCRNHADITYGLLFDFLTEAEREEALRNS